MNELICTLIVIAVVAVIGTISYIGVVYGPKILNTIRGIIKWNIGKFKDNYWD